MKKAILLLLFSTCGLLAACGKKDKADISITDLNYAGVAKEQQMGAQGDYDHAEPEAMAEIPGVQVINDQTDFSYAYAEQNDGSLLFTIEGTWSENQTWGIKSLDESAANVKEISQSKAKVEYQIAAQKDHAGYSEFYITLSDTETKNEVYTIVFSAISDLDNKISALNAFGYGHSDETNTEPEDMTIQESSAVEETTEEVYSEDELEYQKDMEKGYDSIVGEYSFPDAFTVSAKGYSEVLGSKTAAVVFTYKGHTMYCNIAPSLTIDDLKQAVDHSDTWKTKKVGETEVVYYTDNSDTTMMWMDEANCCYSLSGRGIADSVFDDAIQLMLNK